MLGQRVDFPAEFPDAATASWREIEILLYMLAIVFGIIEVPSVTVYGVWRGKTNSTGNTSASNSMRAARNSNRSWKATSRSSNHMRS